MGDMFEIFHAQESIYPFDLFNHLKCKFGCNWKRTIDQYCIIIYVHLGSSIPLYVESFGDRLLLMRTHEDLSSDMELLVYVFYGFVVIFNLAECHGIYEIDYYTSFFWRELYF